MKLALNIGTIALGAFVVSHTVQATDCGEFSDQFDEHGLNGGVTSFALFDDGTGPALYAGGVFMVADGAWHRHIGRWNGSGWTPLGEGANDQINDLVVWDDGTGEALYAAGEFTTMDNQPISYLAKWDGQQWSSVGGQITGPVDSIAVYDDGTGPALFVGGLFNYQGCLRIGKWDGTNWSPLGTGIQNGRPLRLVTGDMGDGEKLYVGGSFTQAGGLNASRIATWDGSAWAAVSGQSINNGVRGIGVFPYKGTTTLFLGGDFSTAGDVTDANGLVLWNGGDYFVMDEHVNDSVYSLSIHEDERGSSMYVGGKFTSVGSTTRRYFARWDGESWHSIGGGFNFYASGLGLAVEAFHLEGEPAMYFGGLLQAAEDHPSSYIAAFVMSEAPSILEHPEDLTLEPGDTAMLNVVAEHQDAVSYQWRHDGNDLTDGDGVSGAITSSLVIDSVDKNHAGEYDVVVTNDCGDVISDAAVLSVDSEPPVVGDLTGDGVVNVSDLLALLAAWGDCPTEGECPADLDDNGVINVSDLLILLANWG